MKDLILGTYKKNGKVIIAEANQPREAIQRMRSVVGVFKYMQEPRIETIFKDEKVRIGAVIDGIDQTLPNYPRTVGKDKELRTFTPWDPQGLGRKWDTYMDKVFETAKGKGTRFIVKNLERLNNEFTSKEALDRAKPDPEEEDEDEEDEESEESKEKEEKRRKKAEWARLREDMAGYIAKLEAQWEVVKDWEKPW